MLKKKIPLLILGVLLLAVIVKATTVVYNGFLVNDPALAYSKTFAINLKNGGANQRTIDNLTATAAWSNGTPSATTMTDGSVGQGTFTVTSITGLVGVQASATITVTSTSSLKNSVLFVNGTRLRSFYEWKVGASTMTTAVNIAAVITKLAGIDASAADGVVYATATTAGTAGNAFTLTKYSASNLSLSGAVFSGGVDDAYVQIGTKRLTRGTAWAVGVSTLATADNIVTAINADATLSPLVTASSSSAVITVKADAVGTAGNYALATFPTSITKSGTALTGGTASSYAVNLPTFHKVSHGLTTALPVLYTTTFTVTGLTTATTYYAYKVDADNFKLSNTSTGAVAGTGFLTPTSGSVVGPHTLTFTPLTMTGTSSFKWQASNDNSTWFDLAVASVTLATPYTGSQTVWVFGAVPYHYMRVNFVGPTTGGVNLAVSLYGSNNQ